MRALGFLLEEVDRAQVSMNLVDLERTGIEAACTAVREAAHAAGTEVSRVELVGLVPGRELERCSRAFLAWSGVTAATTIEARLRRAGPDA